MRLRDVKSNQINGREREGDRHFRSPFQIDSLKATQISKTKTNKHNTKKRKRRRTGKKNDLNWKSVKCFCSVIEEEGGGIRRTSLERVDSQEEAARLSLIFLSVLAIKKSNDDDDDDDKTD